MASSGIPQTTHDSSSCSPPPGTWPITATDPRYAAQVKGLLAEALIDEDLG